MADAFSMMMDLLDTGTTDAMPLVVPVAVVPVAVVPVAVAADPVDDIQDRIAEVLALQMPVTVAWNGVVEPPPPRVHDDYNNMLNADARERFHNERVYYETYLFTDPINTTNTTSGYLTNVNFHEEDLITKVWPDERIVVYRCNYGKEVYCGYTEPVPVKKTNRGRKKKEKKKKPRKKQGNGTDFNSQMTFIVRSTLVDAPGGIVPADATVYKIKVFRNGKIQLPGLPRSAADDAIACAKIVTDELNQLLHDGEPLTTIEYLNPVMKNYRIRVKLETLGLNGTAIVSLIALKNILTAERAKPNPDAPPHPAIFDIKYDEGETKLSVKFSTPIPGNAAKKTRVNLMTRGKINILGAFDADDTFRICDYIHWIFEEYFDRVIIIEGGTKHPIEVLEDNIADDVDDIFPPLMRHELSIDDLAPIFYELSCREEARMELANQYFTSLFV